MSLDKKVGDAESKESIASEHYVASTVEVLQRMGLDVYDLGCDTANYVTDSVSNRLAQLRDLDFYELGCNTANSVKGSIGDILAPLTTLYAIPFVLEYDSKAKKETNIRELIGCGLAIGLTFVHSISFANYMQGKDSTLWMVPIATNTAAVLAKWYSNARDRVIEQYSSNTPQ